MFADVIQIICAKVSAVLIHEFAVKSQRGRVIELCLTGRNGNQEGNQPHQKLSHSLEYRQVTCSPEGKEICKMP